MNKLNEILKPKLTKEEAKRLAKELLKQIADILKKNMKLCDSCEYDCETVFDYGTCKFYDVSFDEIDQIIKQAEKKHGIPIFFDWEEYILLIIERIKPNGNYSDIPVFSYVLKISVEVQDDSDIQTLAEYEITDNDFEEDTVTEIRGEWRRLNKIRTLHLEDYLPAFFEV